MLTKNLGISPINNVYQSKFLDYGLETLKYQSESDILDISYKIFAMDTSPLSHIICEKEGNGTSTRKSFFLLNLVLWLCAIIPYSGGTSGGSILISA